MVNGYASTSIDWSADGTRIFFQDAGGTFTINLDGSNRVNLLNSQFVGYSPTWSPDGSRIAFVRSPYSHGYYREIFTINASGGSAVQLTNALPYSESVSPDWSPDGGQIVFSDAADLLSNADSISVINSDGGSYQQILTSNGDTINYEPKWSSDQTKIVFYRNSYNNRAYQIWVMNKDGSGLTQLTYASTNNFHPNWQPLSPKSRKRIRFF